MAAKCGGEVDRPGAADGLELGAHWLNRSDRKAHGTPGDQRLVDLGGDLDDGVGLWGGGEGI